MAKCVIVVPFVIVNGAGQPSFPGVPANQIQGWTIGSYAPPPTGAPAYVLVWLNADQPVIDTLATRADCLLICNVVKDAQGNEKFETTTLNATQRNTVRTKIQNMGFTGAQFGLLNAAIQSSQNRADLVVAIATKAFYRSVGKDFMTAQDVNRTRIG